MTNRRKPKSRKPKARIKSVKVSRRDKPVRQPRPTLDRPGGHL